MCLRTTLFIVVLAAAACGGAARERWQPTSPGALDDRGASAASGPPNQPPSPQVSNGCDSARARWAIGETASDALLERARVAAGAGSARFLRPNQPVTFEFVGSRLNLGLDARGLVHTVVCG